MPRAEEFDAFYTHTRVRLLHQTYAVSGDLGAAAAGLRDAFAHSWCRWHRLRAGDPEGWVRQEAGRLATLRHRAHLRRRLDDTGADADLLDALQSLPWTQRRLVLLQTLGEHPLAAAAGELSLTDAAALEATDTALSALAAGLAPGRSEADAASQLESRLDGLRAVSERVAMPPATTIRRQGRRRQRRGAVAAALVTAGAVVASGLAVALPTPVPSDLESRRQLGDQAAPTTPEPWGASADQLLAAGQLAAIDPDATWQVVAHSPDLYAGCQPQPTDRRSRDLFVRGFRADTQTPQRAVQVVEVSATRAAAARAYQTLVRAYAGCQLPRLQLQSSSVAKRHGGDVRVLVLREWRDPLRTATVVLARTGVVTTALVHTVDHRRGPGAAAMVRTASTALDRMCPTSGGPCGAAGPVRAGALPSTGEGVGFLGVVDLPPVDMLRIPWSGTEPTRTPPDNPAATLCDRADFTDPGLVHARTRSFVMPEADLPKRFGLTETIGLTGSVARAERFVAAAATRVTGCAHRELSAQVRGGASVGSHGVHGRVWRLTFEVANTVAVTYRLGLVRLGARVGEVSFVGATGADVGRRAFTELVLRAAQRVRELDPPAA